MFKSIISKTFFALLAFFPIAFILGMIQTNFQNLLPYQMYFRGIYFFDFYTVTDVIFTLILMLAVFGFLTQTIETQNRKIPLELKASVILIFIAGIVQILFQKIYAPILSSPIEYFREMFIFPILYAFLVYKFLDAKWLKRLLYAYIGIITIFCIFALIQYFFAIFPGVQYDFTQRLVWPYIDPITLKWQSANWVAFLVAPAFIISAIKIFEKRYFFIIPAVFMALVLYFVQSYGAYAAIAAAIIFYLFRALNFKKFLIAFLIIIIAGAGVFFLQKSSAKYKIWSGATQYRYSTSVESRFDIWKMNLNIIEVHPILGVGLNQYQSYFSLNDYILGHRYNEIGVPPHAHNFFISMWTSLGIIGFLAMLLLIVGTFFRSKFSVSNPAIFALVAIMIHGIVDSYYWKPEIAYTLWLIIVFSYLYQQKWIKSQS